MDDERVWRFEESLWIGGEDVYRSAVDADCLMVVPADPFVLRGEAAIAAVSGTPRWTKVELSRRQVARPEEGLIVVAYHARAEREGEAGYEAWCTSTYRRLGHEDWRVVQHQQLPKLALPS
ncbi:MAG: DUF4440 domain-containing protein [Allosphingosinicella sp.]|uniref:DUF4440 domain-containing protein n=1 Tax=Allosphingosinicella sp. TaxID=2823234 RepID=UPI00392D79DE